MKLFVVVSLTFTKKGTLPYANHTFYMSPEMLREKEHIWMINGDYIVLWPTVHIIFIMYTL